MSGAQFGSEIFEQADGRAVEVSLTASLTHEASYRRIDDVGIKVQFLVDGLFANVFAMAEYAFCHLFLLRKSYLNAASNAVLPSVFSSRYFMMSGV